MSTAGQGSPAATGTAADAALVPVRPDLRLAVRRWAGDVAPAFVLVHGLASNARMWDGVAAHLHRAGHRVLALDQRGHGGSDTPDDGYDFATVTGDLLRLLAAEGIERPIVVGQSWGGNVVLEAGARWDGALAGVAAVDGGTIDLQARFTTWEECAEQLAPPSMDGVTYDEIAQWLRDRHPDWPPEGIAGALANFAVADDGTVRAHLPRAQHLQILRALWEQRPGELYGRVDAAMLLVPADAGDAEQAVGRPDEVEAAAAALPRARVRWVSGDHDLHAQQPATVAGLLLDAVADGFFG